MYRDLYGQYTRGRLSLLQYALSRLEVDPLAPVAWVSIDHLALHQSGARSGDLEGLVEYPRRLKGIEVGLFFRGLSPTRTKVSLRSNGKADVSEIAQGLGGGGHAKASGVVLDLPLDEAVAAVVEVVGPAALAAAVPETPEGEDG
jgi:phosphoesterase RecJ-like protein